MLKEYLLTPGPTPIPQRIFDAMACPLMHHRTDAFKAHLTQALTGAKWLMGSAEPPILLAASGTGAMEAVVQNFLKPGDKAVVINSGVFGERWSKIARTLGVETAEITSAWGESPALGEIERTLAAHRDAKALLFQYAETSTTVLHPAPEIIKAARKADPELLVVVDAISAVGTLPVSIDALGADVLVGASQKALMLPPGLSMLALSARASRALEQAKPRSFYFDLLTERESQRKGTTAWTPAISLILGLSESIAMLKEEGIENTFRRHARLSAGCRAGMSACGLPLLSPKFPSPGVTGSIPPEGIDADGIRASMLKDRGVRIAGGQGKLKGKIIRIGHMGYVNEADLLAGLAALEHALTAAGRPVEPGQAVTAALAAFAKAG